MQNIIKLKAPFLLVKKQVKYQGEFIKICTKSIHIKPNNTIENTKQTTENGITLARKSQHNKYVNYP